MLARLHRAYARLFGFMVLFMALEPRVMVQHLLLAGLRRVTGAA